MSNAVDDDAAAANDGDEDEYDDDAELTRCPACGSLNVF